MEFTASSATWIYASRSGAPLNSDNQSEIIAQHGQSYGSFNWDFRAAKGGSSMNPFTTPSSIATGASSTQTCVPFSEIALIPSVYAGRSLEITILPGDLQAHSGQGPNA